MPFVSVSLLLANLCSVCMADLTAHSPEAGECITNHSLSLLQAKFEVKVKENQHSETNENIEVNSSSTHLISYPKYNVVVCACAKCGCTSFADFIYNTIFGRQWDYSGPPWIMDNSDRWEGQREFITTESASTFMQNPEVFSLAIVRDPIERVQSAWKSKVACDEEGYTTDVSGRDKFVPALLALAGNTSEALCLSFPDFVDTLLSVHVQGKDSALNPHFLPQHLDCFKDFPVSKWSMVTNISDSAAAKELGRQLGNTTASSFPHSHQSSAPDSPELLVSETVRRRLDFITKAEYMALGMVLPTRQNDF